MFDQRNKWNGEKFRGSREERKTVEKGTLSTRASKLNTNGEESSEAFCASSSSPLRQDSGSRARRGLIIQLFAWILNSTKLPLASLSLVVAQRSRSTAKKLVLLIFIETFRRPYRETDCRFDVFDACSVAISREYIAQGCFYLHRVGNMWRGESESKWKRASYDLID